MTDKTCHSYHYFCIFILLIPLLKKIIFKFLTSAEQNVLYRNDFLQTLGHKSCFYRLRSLGWSVVNSRWQTANKMANKNVILIIYFCIFILLIPLLKSCLNSQSLQNKLSYTGTAFCRRWAIKKVLSANLYHRHH